MSSRGKIEILITMCFTAILVLNVIIFRISQLPNQIHQAEHPVSHI